MRVLPTVTVLTVAVAAACASGAAVAAIGTGQPEPSQVRRAVSVAAGTTESSYVPITPCRIVDTRIGGGPLVGGAARDFHAVGSAGFAAQGGSSSGCAIPTGAVAIDVSLQSVNSTGPGYVNEAPYGTTFPTTSLLHYVKGQIIGTGSTFPLATASAFDFSLKSSAGHTDVLVDVVGYLVRPLNAFVLGDGSVVHGSREIATTHLATGKYEVDFDRDVSGCSYSATAYTGGEITVEPRMATADAVYVELFTSNGSLSADGDFYLTVSC